MIAYIPLFARGMAITFSALLVSGSISLIIGSLCGIISCNYLGYTNMQRIIKFYTFIAKGIPAYVQILIAYFIIPSMLNINISGFNAGCGALAFCSSGYITEIIRSGINAISPGQWQAAKTLGYPLPSTLKRIILPQALKNIGPALCGEFEQLLKSTSLLATIGIAELTRTGINIISRELNPVPMYLMVAAAYLMFSAVLNGISYYLEKRTSYGQC